MPEAMSVTRLVRRIKNLLEIELGEVWVEGEISNLRKQASGHMYFTLKDEGGQMSCVLFRGSSRNVKVDMRDGLKVRLFGEVSLYEARGQVQLIVRKVEEDGQGDLQKKFEELKSKLKLEGLFDQDRKKEIPVFPTSIGIITSESGAALQDMLNVLSRRAPWVKPVLYPVQVQGRGAEEGIAQAIMDWGTGDGAASESKPLPKVDVIIVGRGGGSIEDLWNFNEEIVARAIAQSEVPIISAVGHETDFTIADFVSDLRAPTPSAAAEMAVPNGEDLLGRTATLKLRAERAVEASLSRAELQIRSFKRGVLTRNADDFLREPMLRLDQLSDSLDQAVRDHFIHKSLELRELVVRQIAQRPMQVIERADDRLSNISERMQEKLSIALERKSADVSRLKMLLRTLGPDATLARGYSITTNADGSLVNSVHKVSSGEELKTRVKGGEISSKVL